MSVSGLGIPMMRGGAPINPEMWGEEEDGLAWGETIPLGQLVLPGYNKSNDHSLLKQDILVSVYHQFTICMPF